MAGKSGRDVSRSASSSVRGGRCNVLKRFANRLLRRLARVPSARRKQNPISANPAPASSASSVCVVAILKDEDPFVEEWVAYHRLIGVDHFYLYDNDPRQPLRERL